MKSLCLDIFFGRTPIYSKTKNENIIIGQAANDGEKIDFNYAKYGESNFWNKMDEKYFLKYGDVLLNSLGHGTLGRCGINLTSLRMLTDGHLIIFRAEHLITSMYIYLYLTLMRGSVEKSAVGTTNQTFLKLNSVENYMIPLPPLAEQKRIVDKLEELEPFVKQYEHLVDENERLDNEFPNKLKQSILQYAMQGKLVQQDPNDEPASVLLNRIRQEKEKLIKEGKIKRDKNEPFIYQGDDKNYYEKIGNKVTDITDKIPFEIPTGWQWTSMKNCSKIVSGFSFKSNLYKNNGIKVIRISDFDSNGILDSEIKRYEYSHKLDNFRIQINDILICMTGGTVGKNCIVNYLEEDSFINQRVAIIRSTDAISCNLLHYFLNSPNFIKYVRIKKNSTNDNISLEDLENYFVPIPPLVEQQRIVKILNLLFNMLNV